MKPVSLEQFDAIHNVLLVGMDISTAYMYAGLTPEQIDALDTDEAFQLRLKQSKAGQEYTLLKRMDDISNKQSRMGKESATAWLLEKLFPKYSSKPQPEQLDIKLNFADSDPLNEDNITVFKPAGE